LNINVLSCFDGISAGQLALQRAGITINNYFSSEVDQYAIKITQKNFPNTIQLGDINNYKTWNLPKIDLIIGGSPCQGFSIAGQMLNFNDPKSKLFFTFAEILKYYNPKYFLLENVKMKYDWQKIISDKIGIEPILINSALVSAQSRQRLYWTNISKISQPKNKLIYLKNIIEKINTDKYFYLNNKNAGHYKELDQKENKLIKDCLQVGEADLKGHDSIKRVYSINGKSPTLTTMGGGHREPKIAEKNNMWRRLTPVECERLQTFPDDYTRGISTSQRYKVLGNSWTVDIIAHIFSYLNKK